MEGQVTMDAEAIRKIAPNYKGKPENFNPLKAKNFKKGGSKRGVADGPKEPASNNRKLQGPRSSHLNKDPTPTRDELIWKEAIFAPHMSIREKEKVKFSINASSLMPLTNDVYNHYLSDNPDIETLITPEGLRYYSTALLWLRAIEVRLQAKENLTATETAIRILTEQTLFDIPEPIMLYLKAIGTITTTGGQQLHPTFPPMPERIIAGHGGYFGLITENSGINTALYTEIPTLGVCSGGIRRVVSQNEPGPYETDLHIALGQENQNLQGYDDIIYHRPEAKNIYRNLQITENDFPEDIENTGLNLSLLKEISQILSTMTTFKLQKITIRSLGEGGSQAQIVTTKPSPGALATQIPYTDVNAIPTSMEKVTKTSYGVAICFGFQLYKEAIGATTSANNPAHKTWCPFTLPAATAVPAQWVDQRNSRRTLPLRYSNDIFIALKKNMKEYRSGVVQRLSRET